MKPKILLLPFLIVLLSLSAFSQDHNPFKSIGKKGKILTLSNGRYEEFFEKDSLERVGSVIVNRYTRKIEKFLNEDSLYKTVFTREQSRFLSVDPLASHFSFYSPYQYAGNTPIQAIDLDGLEEFVVVRELFRSGAVRKVTIQHTVTKDDNKKLINAHFRQVIGENPDGTDKLGNYLTDQKVIRITIDANGNETSAPGERLSAQEQAIVDTRSRNEATNLTDDHWDLTIGKKLYLSETVRNADQMVDKIAERRFRGNVPVFSGSKLEPGASLRNFEGSNNYFYGTSHFSNAGQLGNELTTSLNQLADQLKKADNVTSITLNIMQGAGNANSQQQSIAQQHATTALNNAINLLRARLKGTSITVNAGTVTTIPNSTNADLKKTGAAIGVNATIQ